MIVQKVVVDTLDGRQFEFSGDVKAMLRIKDGLRKPGQRLLIGDSYIGEIEILSADIKAVDYRYYDDPRPDARS